MRETTIGRAQQGPLEAWSRFNPFNNLVRNVEMKSTDRKILILVASLALLLAGCGGGGPSTAPPDPGQTADMAIMDAKDALTAAEAAASSAMTEDAKLAAYREVQRAADNLVAALTTHGGSEADIAAAAGKSGNAKAMADNLAQKIEDDAVAADAAMTALAAKLYDALGTDPLGQDTARPDGIGGFDGTRVDDTGVLSVQVGRPPDLPLALNPLKEDKTAMLAPLHGWTGSVHTATVAAGTNSGAGTYTAHLYSDVEAPTPGKKFSVAHPYDTRAVDGANTELAVVTTNSGVPARIASPQFDHTAGTKEFELPTNTRRVMIDGSYLGVSGTYSCEPTAGQTCSSTVATEGFTLGGGTWTFRATNPEDTLAPTPDTVYPVYGWWQHEAPDGTTRVSTFTGYRGTAEAEALLTGDSLFGTATYKGGAAGIYALQSSTGGTNDAGQFTADAELTATFKGIVTSNTSTGHNITGTIDNFMGSDGMPRDWSVELKPLNIQGNGTYGTYSFNNNGKTTTWSMGGTAASDSGEWEGRLYKKNDAGVLTVGTGRFHSEYENAGRMVGAFGVNLEE